jgi:hypothetical protein
MQRDEILNLVHGEWTQHNLQVLRYCKMQAETFVGSRMEDYPITRHRASVRGNMLWDQIDQFLEIASNNGLFEGIEHCWIKHKGADILTLRGQKTSLTAKHVLTRDEVLPDSENGYRTNNKLKNQRCFDLFREFETEDGDPIHIVWQHGGKGEIFAYLKAYFAESDPLTLSDDIMLLPDLESEEESEFVLQPSVALKTVVVTPESSMPEPLKLELQDDSQS